MSGDSISAVKILTRIGACRDAINWCGSRSVKEAWEECDRGDWLLWVAAKLGVDRKLIVLAACDCARTVLHLVAKGEKRPRIATETAERWANGEASIDEVRAADAADAAYAASASAAYAAADAAAAAAYAADTYEDAADAAYAAITAAAAAYAAITAGAAVYAAAAYAAFVAARSASLAASAALVRKRIPLKKILEAIAKL